MQFLDALGGRWNISLFHYRNHGADFGRVLAGFEVERGAAAFHAFLEQLGYPYLLEHDNPAYLSRLNDSGRDAAVWPCQTVLMRPW
jgi:threonine dehydratase